MKLLKNNKIIIATGTLAIFTFGVFFLGNSKIQLQTENIVEANAMELFKASNAEINVNNIEEDAVIKSSQAYANSLLKEVPNLPLLKENAISEYGINSLETALNEVNATYNAKKTIIKICKDYHIDPNTAIISDLTLEQITEIDAEVYKNSDHPKN